MASTASPEAFDSNVDAFRECLSELNSAVSRMGVLKRQGKEPSNITLKQESSHCLSLFMKLRGLIRHIVQGMLDARETTRLSKLGVDALNLQLQNLLYEQIHLEEEIETCQSFKSEHEYIDLVSLDQFFKEAPSNLTAGIYPTPLTSTIKVLPKNSDESISQGNGNKEGEGSDAAHQLMLNRLAWDLEERKRLVRQLEDLKSKKEAVQAENDKQRKFLDDMLIKLEHLSQAAAPIEESMSVEREETLPIHDDAPFLPLPLYILFSQALGYQKVLVDGRGVGLEVHIGGDADAARVLFAQNRNIKATVMPSTSADGTAMEDVSALGTTRSDSIEVNTAVAGEEDDVDGGRGERRGRKTHSKNKLNGVDADLQSKRCDLVRTHPLHVSLHLRCSGDTTLAMDFFYVMKLGIITVKHAVTPSFQPGDHGRWVNSSEKSDGCDLLCNLFPGDAGLESPNPASEYQLSALGLGSFSGFVGEVGHAYRWAQWLGGLSFWSVAEASTSGGGSGMEPRTAGLAQSRAYFTQAVAFARQRVDSRISLLTQISELSSLRIPTPESPDMFPLKATCVLSSWTELATADVRCSISDLQSPSAVQRASSVDVSSSTRHFRVVFEREGVNLIAVIELCDQYPIVPPLFTLGTTCAKKHVTVPSDSDLHALEAEVNVYYNELVSFDDSASKEAGGKVSVPGHSHILSLQLRRLQMCFDIFIETLTRQGVNDVGKGKLFSRPFKGVDRMLSYKFNSVLGVFTQR